MLRPIAAEVIAAQVIAAQVIAATSHQVRPNGS
jgi:hypothetical protein